MPPSDPYSAGCGGFNDSHSGFKDSHSGFKDSRIHPPGPPLRKKMVIPSLRRLPLFQTARLFSEWSPVQTSQGGQVLLHCWVVLEKRQDFTYRKACRSCSPLPHHSSIYQGKLAQRGKNSPNFLWASGFPGKGSLSSAPSQLTAPQPPQAWELFIASHPKHRLLFWVSHAWSKAQLQLKFPHMPLSAGTRIPRAYALPLGGF